MRPTTLGAMTTYIELFAFLYSFPNTETAEQDFQRLKGILFVNIELWLSRAVCSHLDKA
jgi:hypothetical protein